MFKKIYSTKINVTANFVGSVWTALLTVYFVPLYLPYIGIEAYGLIGIFTSIQAFIALLDFGLSPTLNRELARLAALGDQTQAMRDLKRTLEIPNWVAAALIAVGLAALAPLLAVFWIQPKELSVSVVTQALVIMSVNIAVQFSTSFYVGGLLGMQKQVHLNAVNVVCSTLRSAGAYAVVAFVSPTIQAFLLWQGAVAALNLILAAILLKQSLPKAPARATFQKDLLRRIWRFAAGMTGITVVSLILTQTDKLILSRFLSLEDFGYYALATTISGMAVVTIVGSITNSVYPKFSAFVSLGDEAGLREFYHRSCQILAAFLMPTVAVIAVFSYDILLIWTRYQENVADRTHLLLTVTIVGAGLNGLMWIPARLQLAYGWTKLGFYVNLGATAIIIPLAVGGALKYGALGAAAAFVTLNVFYILVTIQAMHRRLLKGEQRRWYWQDTLLPLVVSLAVVGGGRWLFSEAWSPLVKIFYFGLLAAAAFGITILTLPRLRALATGYIINVASPKHSYN